MNTSRMYFVYLTVERNQELFEDVETVVWRDEVPEKGRVRCRMVRAEGGCKSFF